MLHDTLRMVFGKGMAKLCKHAHVSPFQAETSLQQTDKLVKVAVTLILLDKLGQFFRMYDQIETAYLSKAEFLFSNTGLVDLAPDYFILVD